MSQHPRSYLSIPASNQAMIAKGLDRGADLPFLDLEDSVAETEKAAGRANVLAVLQSISEDARIAIRINPVESAHCYRDLIDLVEGGGGAIRRFIIPKVDSRDDVVMVARLLDQIERGIGREHQIELDAQIESASGLVNCESIAFASPRLCSLVFGPGDYAASVGIPTDGIGAFDDWDDHYPGHRWHYAMSRILVAAKAAGLDAVDGPYAAFQDETGLRRSAMIARAIGFNGKWCIHPRQIETVNEVFCPSQDELDRAGRVLSAWKEAAAAGRGSIEFDGQMIDEASAKIAAETIRRAGAD